MLGLSGTIGQRPASQPCGAWRQAADPENIKAVTRQNYLGRVKYIDAARLRDATLPIITAQIVECATVTATVSISHLSVTPGPSQPCRLSRLRVFTHLLANPADYDDTDTLGAPYSHLSC